jgi:hypothetical protein
MQELDSIRIEYNRIREVQSIRKVATYLLSLLNNTYKELDSIREECNRIVNALKNGKESDDEKK